jgi:hypothetical protein
MRITEVTESTGTEVTESTGTEVTESTGTEVTESTGTEVTESTGINKEKRRNGGQAPYEFSLSVSLFLCLISGARSNPFSYTSISVTDLTAASPP